jgi:hypothetical protein
MRISIASFVVAAALLVSSAMPSHAIQPNWSEEQLTQWSTHIVTGNVVRVYSTKDEDEGNAIVQHWTIELAVQSVEKGAGPGAGKITWLRGWKLIRYKDPMTCGGQGIEPPTAGQRIRVHAAEAKDGGLDVLHPNGWSVAK